jgi:hypothetical protein
MALSGSRLTSALAGDYLTQLEALFPINGSLLSAEQSGLTNSLQNLANALANAGGPDIVSEITGHAVLDVTSVSGVQTGGSSSGPGTGTVT